MSKIAKIIGIGVAILLTLFLVLFIWINTSDIPSYEKKVVSYQAESTENSVVRGKKLVMMLCANCHMNRQTGKLTGIQMLEVPPEFGKIYSANITQDETYGIGLWSDADLLYLFRTGIKKNGQYTPPYMAKMPLMADDDVNAIISFLRSDDPMVKADNQPDIPSEPTFLTKLLCRIAWKPFPMPEGPIPMPDTTNSVVLGKYLATNLECFSCHSADFKTNDYLNPEKSKGYFGGGNKPLDQQGRVMNTPNLTPDQLTGIGNWTKEQFISAVRFGRKEGENALVYPMMPYTQLSDFEVGAIFDYLQTIPAIENKVNRSVYD